MRLVDYRPGLVVRFSGNTPLDGFFTARDQRLRRPNPEDWLGETISDQPYRKGGSNYYCEVKRQDTQETRICRLQRLTVCETRTVG
jgi:hypothetical protein